ncbi:hypothetical protein EWB00_000611 [Schistosoma japonicum]|uniref:Uncharacterized protein n=1 Tax=Schistosoma japonicum TaxID=6182 RepID=A0A4Z2CK96_SCHJA|nr:hypothetical protein EWB00_000611 [Schistosoma japonicum]
MILKAKDPVPLSSAAKELKEHDGHRNRQWLEWLCPTPQNPLQTPVALEKRGGGLYLQGEARF